MVVVGTDVAVAHVELEAVVWVRKYSIHFLLLQNLFQEDDDV